MISFECYVDELWCINNLKNKKIYIFGAGVDGELVCKKLKEKINIVAFIDNKKQGTIFCDKEVIDLGDYKNIKMEDSVILVALYRYATEVIQQLLAERFVAGEEFVVWDDIHILQPDDICNRYVDFMKKLWQEKKIESDNEILLAFDNRHDTDTVVYSYCTNYLAEKYNASIKGFCRHGADSNNASGVLLDIYKAFNMDELIKTELTEEQQNEAKQVFKELWNKLYTWEDWKNISIYGVDLGTVFITVYLRMEIPSFNLRDEDVKRFIKRSVDTVVFWYHYITEHKVKAVVLADGVCWEGYIREIALAQGIPVYVAQYTMQRAYHNFHDRRSSYKYYRTMWEQLTKEEQEYGIEWAKEHVEARIGGKVEDLDAYTAMNYTFAQDKSENRFIEKREGINVLICPHIFEENSYLCGEHIFDNSYFAWLCHLGDLSERTPQYNWYMKMHPAARRRDPIIINKVLEKYPKIKLLPANISPKQLKAEGIQYALTVCGTLGHEYPAIGIEVINAGENPHSTFDFTWNPKTKEEYDNLILNLENLRPKNNLEELYKFYCIHYLYYDKEYIPWREVFFDNPYLGMVKEQ